MKPIAEQKKTGRMIGIVLATLALTITLILSFATYQSAAPTNSLSLVEDSTLEPPSVSHATGFYTSAFYLTIRAQDPATKIYFSLDGTEPTTNSSEYKTPVLVAGRKGEENILSQIPTSPVWQAPLEEVFKGTVVKVIAVKDNFRSKPVAQTYFIDPKGRGRYSLPIMLLTVNPDDFFSFRNGIYVRGRTFEDKDYYTKTRKPVEQGRWWFYPSNYTRRGIEWERKTQIEYLETGENKGVIATAGIRIHGNATRGYSQKSLKVHLRKVYGDSLLAYDFFKGKGQLPIKAFLLRNSGQDLNSTMFRDAFLQSLLEDITIDKQSYQPCVLFINGEYWGLHNIRERIDPDYLSLKYKMPMDSFSIINPVGDVEFGEPGDGDSYNNLKEYIGKNKLENPVHYNYVRQRLDINNLIDYLITEIYFANGDWPHNNMEMWRYKLRQTTDSIAYKDGRWRWLVFDMDAGFGHKYSVSTKSINYVLSTPTLGWLFGGLLKNSHFRTQFFSRYSYHLEHTFKPEKVIARIDAMQAVIATEMPEHLNRWRTIASIKEWEKNVEGMRRFARERPIHQKKEIEALRKKFGDPPLFPTH